MPIPKTMKAAILVEQRKPLVIDEVILPQALEVGQVLVKIHYSGICGSQIGEIDGAKGEDKFLPHLLGHEASGTVMEIGPGVKHTKMGDTVVLHWRKGNGIEAQPPNYIWRGSKLNAGWITTLNEYSIVSENRITVIDQASDLQVAALFGCAVTTGFGVIENDAMIRIGESVVIYGAGGVGLNMVQAASLVGAYPIIAIDIHDNRLGLAKIFGATHTINPNKTNIIFEINRINNNSLIDKFIDNTGIPEIIELGYKITKTKGKIVLVGVPKINNNINIFTLPLHFGKLLIGSEGGGSQPNQDIPRYKNLFDIGKVKLSELITEINSLDDINESINNMKTGKTTGRVLIKMH